MSRTVAELLVDTLAQLGVRHVFGVVGDALNPFTHALDAEDAIDWIGVRHEEGGALAAAGQAKLTGRLGVCCGTTGPGGNHLVAGLYEARKDHAPVLAITGGVPAEKRGTDYLQEDDPALLFRDVAVYSQVISAAEQAPAVIREAIAAAYAERGVAHINVPPEVFAAKVESDVASMATLRPRPEIAPSPADVAEAARMIGEAKTVAVFCGQGCHGAGSELEQLADRLQAPLMHTFRGKSILPFDHRCWIGGVGLIGSKAGVDAINGADLLLMLGTDYPYSEFLPQHGRIIQIDERALALGRRAPVALGIVGSVRPALTMLLERLSARSDRTFLEKAQAARDEWNAMLDKRADVARTPGKLHPPALARAISNHAADDAIVVTDTGEVTLWAANWWRQSGRQQHTGSFNNAAVGTGLGLANGAQLLDRSRQVIAHVGDGGMTMLLGEFMTSVEHQLPVKIVVYDNAEWGLVHLEMEVAGLPAAKGSTFPNIDFAAFAKACGAQGFTVRDPAQLDATIAQFLAAPGPAILHAIVDPDELPTMPHIDPAKVLRFGIAKVREAWHSLRGPGA
ncbi:thiamine pyrophosphate-binding protein [Novosphingobium sp. BL-8H]|uniref:thiamine pyrophosphate-binding protein n=1 Tax=Novosphingobium sp. BL-8H TaxID=3127640 RepID=UPI003757A078